MILIVGLGNPEKKYAKTRHNVGFRVIDKLAESYGLDLKEEKKFKAQMVRVHEGPDEAILAKPLTYMNLSGEAVKKIADFYEVYENDIWVIHDDIDIELGKLRIRKGGSSAGQKGVQSVIDNLGTPEFIRFRIGVKPTEGINVPAENFVLGKFRPEEEEVITGIVDSVTVTIKEAVGGNDIEITTK